MLSNNSSADILFSLSHESNSFPYCIYDHTKHRNLILSDYFNFPINEVAEKIDLSMSSLKKLCRKASIIRWPFRKIECIRQRMISLQVYQSEFIKDIQVLETALDTLYHFPNKKYVEVGLSPTYLKAIDFKIRHAMLLKKPTSLPITKTICKPLRPKFSSSHTLTHPMTPPLKTLGESVALVKLNSKEKKAAAILANFKKHTFEKTYT